MKKNILRISILPLVLLVALSFTELQPQKENNKGNKGNNAGGKGNQNNQGQGNRENNGEDRSSSGQGKGKNDQPGHANDNSNGRGNQKNKGNDNSGRGKSDDHGNSGKSKNNNNNGQNKENGNGKSRREMIVWDRADNIQWGFDNYSSRKRPKDYKKVTICHNTGDSNYPVSISVSENAMKAHLNHGDRVGNCTVDFSDRWPGNYIRTRENVYNSYENTWETMSYSEALLRYAAEKLLGVKSTFQTQRPSLTSQEIQRREGLILELQNNVYSLENQLNATRQRTDGININIML